jgi:hypothetical protein
MTEIIREKVSLLRDFCILKGNKDPRTAAVKEALKQCGTELRMQNMLHDVLVGRTTLDEMLKKKGLM